MQTLQPSGFLKTSPLIGNDQVQTKETEHTNADHKRRITQELRKLGLSRVGLLSMEGRYISNLIHNDEQLHGVVYGYNEVGFSMLAVTNNRVLFLDRKPLFTNEDEVTFDIIGGVTVTHAIFWTTLTLHTRIKDYKILTLNKGAAKIFERYIEERCLEHRYGGVYDYS